jgi:hypothetical protein
MRSMTCTVGVVGTEGAERFMGASTKYRIDILSGEMAPCGSTPGYAATLATGA